MKHFINAIKFTAQKPYLLALFILFGILPVFLYLSAKEGETSIIPWVALALTRSFMTAGLLSMASKSLVGAETSLRTFLSGSVKYFLPYIGVRIITATLTIVFVGLPLALSENTPLGSSIDIITEIIAFVLLLVFVYAIPFVFVSNMKTLEALRHSVTFLSGNISISAPVILLCIVLYPMSLLASNLLTSAFESSATMSFQLYVANSAVTIAIEYLVFLTASSLLYEKLDLSVNTDTLDSASSAE